MKQTITRWGYYHLAERDRKGQELSAEEQRLLKIGSGIYREVAIGIDGTVSSCASRDRESDRSIEEEYQKTISG